MLIAQVLARKIDQLFLHFRLCLRCWCAAGFACLGFDVKSWLNSIWALGWFAYKHPACSLYCHIKRERCFLKLSHVSTVDWYQIIVCSAGAEGDEAQCYPEQHVFSSAPLHRLFAFCVKGTLFLLCTPGKALHTESLRDPKAVASLCASCTFYSISSAIYWRVTVDFPYLTDLVLLF